MGCAARWGRAGVFLPRGHGWNLGLILVSGRESRVTKFQIHLTLDIPFVLHPPVSSQADRWNGRKQNIPDRFREE